MDRHQLHRYQLSRNSNDQLLLLFSGTQEYKTILFRAFPELTFTRTFPARYGPYAWGTYIRGADAALEIRLNAFCQLLQTVVYISDDLDECFALAFHSQIAVTGGYERSPVGRLVRAAKPYDQEANAGDLSHTRTLAKLYADFIQQHPRYLRAEIIVAVPPSNPNKAFDLPLQISAEIADRLKIPCVPNAVVKNRPTTPMKDCRSIEAKMTNLVGAFTANPVVVSNRVLLLIDDIYETGFSMNTVGQALQQAGAKVVLGLVATKTLRDSPKETGQGEDDAIPF